MGIWLVKWKAFDKRLLIHFVFVFRYLLDKIKYEKLEKQLNLIILSDHGMETVTYDGIIFLDKYVSNTTYKIVNTGPNAFVYPKPGKSCIIQSIVNHNIVTCIFNIAFNYF